MVILNQRVKIVCKFVKSLEEKLTTVCGTGGVPDVIGIIVTLAAGAILAAGNTWALVTGIICAPTAGWTFEP